MQKYDPKKAADSLPASPNCVTVFGAGIAGLTVAHELVERGFQVQVWERDIDDRRPERGCDVGGLARTQWAAVNWPSEVSLDNIAPDDLEPFHERPARPITHIPKRIYFRWTDGIPKIESLDTPAGKEFSEYLESRLTEFDHLKDVEITVRAAGVSDLPPATRKQRVGLGVRDMLTRLKHPLVALNTDDACLTFRFKILLPGPRDSGPRECRIQIRVDESANADASDITFYFRDEQGGAIGAPLHAKGSWMPGAPDQVDGALKALATIAEQDHQPDVYMEVAIRNWDRMSDGERGHREMILMAVVNSVRDFANANPVGVRATTVTKRGQLHEFSLISTEDESKRVRLLVAPIAELPYPKHEPTSGDLQIVVSFRPRERWLPGEHGYRFFPSFYHHVFDTMKRTPLLDVQAKTAYAISQERAVGFREPEPVEYIETGRTVYDNLQPTSSHVLALSNGQRPSQLSRSAIRSFEELREYLRILFGGKDAVGFGLGPRDVSRITLKLLQFATSCDARRKDYEKDSFWDFVGGDELSQEGKELVERWPKALVAMSGKECDARTQWVPLIQLLLDQARLDGYRDGTLKGPTSEAWLTPWRRYLEAQGVEFIHGELIGFTRLTEEKTKASRVWPKVQCYDPRYGGKAPPLHPGYFVLAVSADEAQRLAQDYLKEAPPKKGADEGEVSDFARIAALQVPAHDRPIPAAKKDNFRDFAGIQFYFAEDVYWIDGHVYYPETPWGLTSVSQARFWQDKMDWEHGYRGVLSVIIGSWETPDEDPIYGRKKASECSPSELARRVWNQIKEAIQEKTLVRRSPAAGRFVRRSGAHELPEPLYFHLDQNLEHRKDPDHFINHAPFFVALPGHFENRPGDLEHGYRVENGFVIAGQYTKTHTRLPCMEAANESGRHAVNAILQHLIEHKVKGHELHRSLCDIWNPEDREIDDLAFWKELDARLCERGVPHLLDVIDLASFSDNALRGGPNDPFDPVRLLAHLSKMAQAF